MAEAENGGSKLKRLLKSRKFWVLLGGLLVVLLTQLLDLPESRAKQIADLVVLLAAAYIGGVALEDGLRGVGNGTPGEDDGSNHR